MFFADLSNCSRLTTTTRIHRGLTEPKSVFNWKEVVHLDSRIDYKSLHKLRVPGKEIPCVAPCHRGSVKFIQIKALSRSVFRKLYLPLTYGGEKTI